MMVCFSRKLIKEVLNINGVWFLYTPDKNNLGIHIKVGIEEKNLKFHYFSCTKIKGCFVLSTIIPLEN